MKHFNGLPLDEWCALHKIKLEEVLSLATKGERILAVLVKGNHIFYQNGSLETYASREVAQSRIDDLSYDY